ncbi:hypothetical protein Trydic_g21752 [Trypoxylus dichotomus]
MISHLKSTKDNVRKAQLSKMESLLSMITNANKKWKYEILLKCEEVIVKLKERMKSKLSQVLDVEESKQFASSKEVTPKDSKKSKDVFIRDDRLAEDPLKETNPISNEPSLETELIDSDSNSFENSNDMNYDSYPAGNNYDHNYRNHRRYRPFSFTDASHQNVILPLLLESMKGDGASGSRPSNNFIYDQRNQEDPSCGRYPEADRQSPVIGGFKSRSYPNKSFDRYESRGRRNFYENSRGYRGGSQFGPRRHDSPWRNRREFELKSDEDDDDKVDDSSCETFAIDQIEPRPPSCIKTLDSVETQTPSMSKNHEVDFQRNNEKFDKVLRIINENLSKTKVIGGVKIFESLKSNKSESPFVKTNVLRTKNEISEPKPPDFKKNNICEIEKDQDPKPSAEDQKLSLAQEKHSYTKLDRMYSNLTSKTILVSPLEALYAHGAPKKSFKIPKKQSAPPSIILDKSNLVKSEMEAQKPDPIAETEKDKDQTKKFRKIIPPEIALKNKDAKKKCTSANNTSDEEKGEVSVGKIKKKRKSICDTPLEAEVTLKPPPKSVKAVEKRKPKEVETTVVEVKKKEKTKKRHSTPPEDQGNSKKSKPNEEREPPKEIFDVKPKVEDLKLPAELQPKSEDSPKDQKPDLPLEIKEEKKDSEELQLAKELFKNASTSNVSSTNLLEFFLDNFKHIKKIFESDSSGDESKSKRKTRKKKKKHRKRDFSSLSTSSSSTSEDENSKSKKKSNKSESKSKEEEAVVAPAKDEEKNQKKIKTMHRKNELDILHADIKEMWMSGDVINATGKRSCTVNKEDATVASDKEEIAQRMIRNASRLKVEVVREDFSKYLGRSVKIETLKSKTNTFADLKIDCKGNITLVSVKGAEKAKDDIENEAKRNQKSTSGKKKKSARNVNISDIRGDQLNDEPIPATSKAPNLIPDTTNEDTLACVTLSNHHDKNYYVLDEKTSCRLCPYKGKVIYVHYKTKHKTNEVLISRINPQIVQLLVESSKKKNYETLDIQDGPKIKYTFVCPFCSDNLISNFASYFYDHLTSHTGEFRYFCDICNYNWYHMSNMNLHNATKHKKTAKITVKPGPPNSEVIFGHICMECHYVQISKDNVVRHVEKYHENKGEILKINLNLNLNLDDSQQTNKADLEVDTMVEVKIEETQVQEPPKLEEIRVEKLVEDRETPGVVEDNQADPVILNHMLKPAASSGNLSAFICESDTTGENTHEERLEKMKVILENVNIQSIRTSIADKLQSKFVANKAAAVVKPLTSPTHEKQIIPRAENNIGISAKPSRLFLTDIQTVDVPEATNQSSNPQKKLGAISNIINRLQNNLQPPNLAYFKEASDTANKNQSKSSTTTPTSDTSIKTYRPAKKNTLKSPADGTKSRTSDQLPPLSHYKNIVNTSQKAKVVLQVGPIKFLRNPNGTIFYACFITQCVFCTDKRELFGTHCKIVHANIIYTRWQCKLCSEQIDSTTLYQVFIHAIEKHGDARNVENQASTSSNTTEDSGMVSQATSLILENNTSHPKYNFVITEVKSLSKQWDVPQEPLKDHLELPANFADGAIDSANQIPIIDLSDDSDNTQTTVIAAEVPTSSCETKVEIPEKKAFIRPVALCKLLEDQNSSDANAGTSQIPTIQDEADPNRIERKTPYVMNCQLNGPQLTQFYKCPAFNCTFSSFGKQAFSQHIKHHFDCFVFCLYCSDTVMLRTYISHLELAHYASVYACSHCYYRASCTSFVRAHIETVHKNVEKVMIVATPSGTMPIPPPSVTIQYRPVQDLLRPYKCPEPGCTMATIFSKNFMDHYHRDHLTSGFKKTCADCGETFGRSILRHYSSKHGIHAFHCRYCAEGSHCLDDVVVHLATMHSNMPFKVVSRANSDKEGKVPLDVNDEYDYLVEITQETSMSKYTPVVDGEPQSFNYTPPNPNSPALPESTVGGSGVAVGTQTKKTKAAPRKRIKRVLSRKKATIQPTLEQPTADGATTLPKKKRKQKKSTAQVDMAQNTLSEDTSTGKPTQLVLTEPIIHGISTDQQTDRNEIETASQSTPLNIDYEMGPGLDGTIYPWCRLCGVYVTKGICWHLRKRQMQGCSGLMSGYVVTNVMKIGSSKSVQSKRLIAEGVVSPTYVVSNRYCCGAEGCDEVFQKKDDLAEHVEIIHTIENVYICRHCEVSVNFKKKRIDVPLMMKHLSQHERTIFGCSYCSFLDDEARNIEVHTLNVHHKKRLLDIKDDRNNSIAAQNLCSTAEIAGAAPTAEPVPDSLERFRKGTSTSDLAFRFPQVSYRGNQQQNDIYRVITTC